MQSKFSFNIILRIVIIGGFIFLISFFYFNFKNARKEIISNTFNIDNNGSEQVQEIIPEIINSETEILEEQKLTTEFLMRLKIPIINVDASVESLGLTENGNMDTPKGPDNVAWYKLGTRPGESGSAVITGHFGTWKNGKEPVFNKLHTLNVGDKIYIEYENENTIAFTVREIRSFDPQADASEIFSSEDEKVHLNLITCQGIWDKDSKSYSQRLVVFADMD